MYISLDTAVFLTMRSAFKAMAPILAGCTALYALAPTAALAQTAGTIHYQRVLKPNIPEGIELPPALPEEIREMLLASMSAVDTTAWRLHFTEKASLMTQAPDSAATSSVRSANSSGRNTVIRTRRTVEQSITHTDLEAWSLTEQRDFLGRTFLIKEDRPEYAWRLTGQQSEYLGYACQQAVTEVDSTTVEAWFAPEIPVSVGPDSFGGLPGAILVLTSDREARATWSATHVSLEPPDEAELQAPDKGRRVTREEFENIVEEKTEEMDNRGGGNFMIRIER